MSPYLRAFLRHGWCQEARSLWSFRESGDVFGQTTGRKCEDGHIACYTVDEHGRGWSCDHGHPGDWADDRPYQTAFRATKRSRIIRHKPQILEGAA